MWQRYLIYFCTTILISVQAYPLYSGNYEDPYRSGIPQLWITISAKQRFIEVSWINARMHQGDIILLTDAEPDGFQKLLKDDIIHSEDSENIKSDITVVPITEIRTLENKNWKCNNSNINILAAIQPNEPSQWIATSIKFNYNNFINKINKNTKCYGYWANYVDRNGDIISYGCIRAHGTWMNDMKSVLGQFRIRDLMIPGSHDTGSYRKNFSPERNETIVTKYSLTQDDDIKSQLMHGIRYLDIRIGYYRKTPEEFFINHGISKQVPLNDVVNQVIDFILDTNEIIIFDVQEFPIGFGKDLTIHRKLVQYLKEKFGNLLIDPTLSWQTQLSTVWQKKQNIFLSYDNLAVVAEFPFILFPACEQRWGNKQKWTDLEKYLKRIHEYDTLRLSSRPVSDMAELTPENGLSVILDKYGGLRKMADSMNWLITKLYREELGKTANIVSVDFYRGTAIVDLSIYYNYKKVI